jgi:hypothetical protein
MKISVTDCIKSFFAVLVFRNPIQIHLQYTIL